MYIKLAVVLQLSKLCLFLLAVEFSLKEVYIQQINCDWLDAYTACITDCLG